MRRGHKENSMTVALGRQQKRHVDGGNEFSTARALKKLRPLESLQLSQLWQPSTQSSLGPLALSPPGLSTTTAGAKVHKKRSRLEAIISPAGGKRGKRTDGSSTTAVSPSSAAAALDDQLTFPGLERDSDLEVQHAYISRQLQHPGNGSTAQQRPGAAADRVSVPRRQAVVSNYAFRDCQKDAAKSSKGRDQAACRRRDQQISADSTAEAEAPALFSNDSSQEEERVCLNLVTDKEWQRLFAVLTISGQPKHGDEQQQPGGNANSSSTAAATAAAPVTPSKHETGPLAVAAAAKDEAVTPVRKSFLVTEFSRVQARLTPVRDVTSQRSSMAWR